METASALSPRDRYRADLESGLLLPDAAQHAAVAHTQRLYQALCAERSAPAGGLRGWMRTRRRESIAGLYMWGDVGRGKTRIMNALHDALPLADKLRIHFHGFMQYVHAELAALDHESDPLETIARRLAEDTRIICFDEFQVSDITDAMLLGRLLRALFQSGVTLVATSNTAPDDLYPEGLQRSRFLPAIDLLNEHTRVVRMDGAIDYRLRALERAEIYHCPLDAQAEASLLACFQGLSPEDVRRDQELEISGRSIATRWTADGIAWFEFSALCAGPRSTSDYIELARRFHTVLVGNVPQLDDEAADPALRFIHLVDEFYHRHVNLILSAAAPPSELYEGRRLTDRFARTRSRLQEMQTRAYLAQPHLG